MIRMLGAGDKVEGSREAARAVWALGSTVVSSMTPKMIANAINGHTNDSWTARRVSRFFRRVWEQQHPLGELFDRILVHETTTRSCRSESSASSERS